MFILHNNDVIAKKTKNNIVCCNLQCVEFGGTRIGLNQNNPRFDLKALASISVNENGKNETMSINPLHFCFKTSSATENAFRSLPTLF